MKHFIHKLYTLAGGTTLNVFRLALLDAPETVYALNFSQPIRESHNPSFV